MGNLPAYLTRADATEIPNPEELFIRISGGNDKEAFHILFDEFFPPLCYFARQYVPDGPTCEDLVQDVFFKIWMDRHRLDIRSSARNYLTTLVRNRCIDYLRRKNLEQKFRDKELLKPHLSAGEEVYSVTECEEMINRALDKLPENIRTVFEMNRFRDMNYAEIASVSGISVKTVEAYMSRALKILREQLKDYLPFVILFLYSDF